MNHRATLAELDAMAYVIIRPSSAADDNDDLGTYAVEAASHGMSKRAAAYALRQVADRFDADAAAVGDEPLDADTIAEANARNAQRPAGLDALLDHVAAHLDDEHTSPVLSALARALLDEERAPTPVAAYGAARILLAEHARDLYAMLRAAAHARCDCCLDQAARLAEYAGHLTPHLTPARPVNDEHQAAEEQPAPLTLGDRADHAIGLYATTAVELEDARAEAAQLRARVAELEAAAHPTTAEAGR
ncbi:hypothetical protein [Streptomyces sp900116325]|uniref:hypothetical protein n=1 Tax=Streptomyces sp. 900116325 TaxID=3154295 RepID=UPI0033A3825A